MPRNSSSRNPPGLEEIQHFLDNRRTHVGMLEQLIPRCKDPAKRQDIEKRLEVAQVELAEATRQYVAARASERKGT